MPGTRERGRAIQRFILERVDSNPDTIAQLTVTGFGISRQAVNKHLRRLVREGLLTAEGVTRNRRYALAVDSVWREKIAPLLSDLLSEGQSYLAVWLYTAASGQKVDTRSFDQHDSGGLCMAGEDRPSALRPLSEGQSYLAVWLYRNANNAIDHSSGTSVYVTIERTAISVRISLMDDGEGIFRKIQRELDLLDERHSVLELAKGKLTTDPDHHTGEGIFFTSRMFDEFSIRSGEVFFSHRNPINEDWILETSPLSGTGVFLTLSNDTERTTKEVFDEFTSGEDYGFSKTVVPVDLVRYGDEALVSRSQAKRLLTRFERFRTVILDFEGVDQIGQGFADEVFRVFARAHPDIELVSINENAQIRAMIKRVSSTG